MPSIRVRRSSTVSSTALAPHVAAWTLAVATLIWASSPAARADTFTVAWTGTGLTVVAADAPLAAVLNEVGRQTGVTFIGLDRVTDVVTIEIRDVPLYEALRSLLDNRDHVMTNPATQDARPTVWLEGRGTNRALVPTSPRGAGPSGDDRESKEPDPLTLPYDIEAARAFRAKPSPADAEAARLSAENFFTPDAPESALIGAANASADPGVRTRALQTLAIQNTDAGRQTLQHALEDSNPHVRNEALSLLLSIGENPDANRGLSDLLVHRDPTVRLSALMALGERSGDDVEFQLKRALHDEDNGIRDMAAHLIDQRKKGKR